MAFVSRREMQEARNQAVADTQQSAHYRYLQRRAGAAGSSDWEQKRVARELSNYNSAGEFIGADEKLRRHEIDMLKQQGENALNVEKAKVDGMIGQGSKAAEFNAEASKYTADAQKEAALKKAEVDAANGAAQFGKFENGQYIAGSNVSQAKAQTDASIKAAEIKASSDKYAADASVDVQTEKNKGIQATVDAERQLEDFKHEHAKELTQMKLEGMLPNRQELMLIQREMAKPENKDKSIGEILGEIRNRSGQN